MNFHPWEAEYHREVICQHLPDLREEVQFLDFTVHRLQQLRSQRRQFHAAFKNLLKQGMLRPAGPDRYELVNSFGTDTVGLLLRCSLKTRIVVPLRYTDVRIRPLITTAYDRRQHATVPQTATCGDCQNESPAAMPYIGTDQQTRTNHSGKEEAAARGRWREAARPCSHTASLIARTPCHNYDNTCFWT